MPLIQVRVIKDVFTKEQKHQMISKLTDTMVSIEGENMRGVTWCVVEEVESGDWGIGGNALTTADVHALARGKSRLTGQFCSRRRAPDPSTVVRAPFRQMSQINSGSRVKLVGCGRMPRVGRNRRSRQ